MLRNAQRTGNFIQIFRPLDRPEKLRLRLGHHHAEDLAVAHVQLDGEETDVALLHHAGDRLRRGHEAELGQHVKGSHHRMAGEGNFLGRREDAQPHDRRRIARREHKHRFREIHLSGDLLQLIVGQAFGLRKHRDRIAAERLRGEHVGLIELQRAASGEHNSAHSRSSENLVSNQRSPHITCAQGY